MLLQIDFKSGTPVYLQLVEQVRHAAAAGALRAGEPLPSIGRGENLGEPTIFSGREGD